MNETENDKKNLEKLPYFKNEFFPNQPKLIHSNEIKGKFTKTKVDHYEDGTVNVFMYESDSGKLRKKAWFFSDGSYLIRVIAGRFD